jgi:competence protein ComEA
MDNFGTRSDLRVIVGALSARREPWQAGAIVHQLFRTLPRRVSTGSRCCAPWTAGLPGADWRQQMFRMITITLLVLGLCTTSAIAQSGSRSAVAAQAAAMVNLNTANVAQLETLPGVGKATAERIVEYREKNGGFKKVEDLMNVRGIGEKSFLKIKPLITVATAKAER